MQASLYDSLGGATGIVALADDIVAAHMANPAIQARFLPYAEQPDRLAAVKRHLRDFLGMGSGGPEHYDGKGMAGAHRGMNIVAEEYMAAMVTAPQGPSSSISQPWARYFESSCSCRSSG